MDLQTLIVFTTMVALGCYCGTLAAQVTWYLYRKDKDDGLYD